MTANPSQPLMDHQPKREFFIGIDSDGCAFDSMEIKHKECFIPNYINYFGLQAISKYAREAAEFSNLYSVGRGANRFPAYLLAMDLCRTRKEVIARRFAVPQMPHVREWIKKETKLGNPALEMAIKEAEGEALEELQLWLDWSKAVNRDIAEMVHDLPPFPGVREALVKAAPKADVIVVSATPGEALAREWEEHGIDKYAAVIAGQEMGKKAEHLKYAATGKYPPDKILMVGDALGDLKAARSNNALFYPVNPGDEERCWDRLIVEAMDKFFAGEYKGEYEDSLVREFLSYLPEKPAW